MIRQINHVRVAAIVNSIALKIISFFEFLIHENSDINTKMNILGAFFQVMSRHRFVMLVW